jgi:hypothetical protein
MHNKIQILIPSYKRAGQLFGYNYFKGARYVISKSQEKDYLQYCDPERLVIMPDEFEGNLAVKRNWILDNFQKPLLMLDDDIDCLMMCEGRHVVKGKEHEKATEKIKMTPEQAMMMVEMGFNLAHEFGCVFWGINFNTDGRNYQQYKPFSLTSIILGPFQGHVDHSMRYDERFPVKHDYDFCLQVMQTHHKALRMNKFSYRCEHGDNSGGIVSMRSMEYEMKYCREIEKKWGRSIIKYPMQPKSMKHLLNGNVRIPVAGV